METLPVKTHALNKSCFFLVVNFFSCIFLLYFLCRICIHYHKCSWLQHSFLLLYRTTFCDPFTRSCSSFSETTHSIFEHIIHKPLEPGNMPHRPRLLKRFVRALHSNFPTITGNRPGGVHMNARCRCFTWPSVQHDIFQPCLPGIMFIYSSFAPANMRET